MERQILLQLTSGRGPVECCWVVAKLANTLLADAKRAGLSAELIAADAGPSAGTLLSALIDIEGEAAELFATRYEGTIQWIGFSRFRPGHKRKNWYVGVTRLPRYEPAAFPDDAIRIDTFRASGPGGQHVNNTATAVRVTHLPTGLSAISQDERSQLINRKRALDRLAILLANREQQQQQQAQQDQWSHHNQLVRGNPVRVYEGEDFRLRG
ncbi:MAG: peptide chain release factor H [Magnetococcales bacterium]|nr:peptide chain release factor H [Magnetococcales bacterium]